MPLTRTVCLPPPNLFPYINNDPSVAVWQISLACALLLGAETLLLWRLRILRAALLPLAGTLGCLALAIAAWVQSRTFIQVVCYRLLSFPPDMRQSVVERAQAALHLNMIYQDLMVAAIVVTLILLMWSVFWLARPARHRRTA